MIVRHPSRELMRMSNAMDRIFDDSLFEASRVREYRLPIDVYTTENEIVLTASVPGINPENIDITVEGDVLTIKGEIERHHEEQEANYLFSERFYGSFSRSLKLNVPVELDNIEAEFDQGVLTLTLPKAEDARAKTIAVKAK